MDAPNVVDVDSSHTSRAESTSGSSGGSPAHRLFVLALTIGVLCRVIQYAADQSYWHDEAAVVLNVRSHTALQLFGPLDFVQAAPPLFLVAERGMFLLFGPSEWSMRLLPLLIGIGTLFLFASLARRLLSAPWAVVAVAGFAMGDRLIWHSCESKPYIVDLFVSLVLAQLAIGPGEARLAGQRMLRVAVAATVAMWCSYTAALAFAGVSLALLPAVVAERAGWRRYIVANLLPGAAFLVVLFTSIHAQRSDDLQNYWIEDFLPVAHPFGCAAWLGHHLFSLFNYATPLASPAVTIGAIAGVVTLWESGRRQLLAILLMPVVITLVAAAVHRYPFDGKRLTLFLSGDVLILAMIGLKGITDYVKPAHRPLTFILPGVLLTVGLIIAIMHIVHPRNRGDMRPVAHYVAAHAQPGDRIMALEQCEFSCYWPENDPRVSWSLLPADAIGSPRFWIVWSSSDVQTKRHFDQILDWVKMFAVQRNSCTFPGAQAICFERDNRPLSAVDLQPPALPK
jgi:4-amino-4-deoxy-L-arabinose transferase-like glycosyltransferase